MRFRLPRGFVVTIFCMFFGFMGGLSALVIDYLRMQRIVAENESLRAENHSIRSEAAAIIARLEGVQSALNRMDNFSSQIREMAKPEASCKGPRCKKVSVPEKNPSQGRLDDNPVEGAEKSIVMSSAAMNGIGPISREDYSLIKGMRARGFGSAVNSQNLEFKEAFEQLEAIGRRSETKAGELERLLGDVSAYNKRIAYTPTLTPTRGYLSSSFGMRMSPVSGREQMHWGIDFAASIGTPVYVAAAGTVVGARWVSDYGKVIDIDHGNGVKTRYAHLNRISVRVGDKLTKGNLIGEVGDTGRSTGPHLHYEVEKDGRRLNPIKFIHDW
jgi:murein DD-endopeptidase MepM/ murein hydrolase activator NlpD